MKAYIIMEKGFEYDDCNYNPTEGGTPKKVFFKKEDAKKEQTNLEIQMMKGVDVSHYLSNDLDDDLTVSKEEFENYIKSLNEKYGIPDKRNPYDRFGEYQLNPKATEEESLKYLKMINFKFFEITECDVDVTSLRDHQIDSILS